jgi:ATP-binding cassette subfamily C protein CydD
MGRWLLILDAIGAAVLAAGLAWAVSLLAESPSGFGNLALPLLLVLASGMIRLVALAGSDILAAKSARSLTHSLRRALALKLFGGRLSRYMGPGSAAAIVLDHSEAFRMREVRFTPVRLAASVSPIIILLLTAAASLVAAGILFFTFVFFILVMILTGTAAARESNAQLGALTALSGLLEDRLLHLPIIRHFGAEERIARQIGQSSHELSRRTVAVLRKAFLSSAALEFFAALAVALVAVYCGFSLLGLLPFPDPEQLTLREAFFALALAPEFYLPMRRLAAAYHEKQMGEAADKAIEPFLEDEEPRSVSSARFNGVNVQDLRIEFEERSIGPIEFTIGMTGLVALAGPTGSGKTSVLSAIAGQLEAVAGFIEVPGTNRPPDCKDIAWAAQRPLFLRGSIAENIALANPQAPAAELERAAQAVGLVKLIEDRGLDLELAADGAGISGGERRRIGLARAILSERPLILCDEPTADLDGTAGQGIADLLSQLARDRALIVATHDPRVLAIADTVVKL